MRCLLSFFAVCILLSSCSGMKYVSVPESHTQSETTASVDSLWKERIREIVKNTNERNDRYRSDSTIIRVDINGKELGRDHWYKEVVNKEETNELTINDSVYERLLTMLNHDRQRADSIAKPYPVEKELGWWDNLKLNTFEPLVLLLMIAVLLSMGKKRY